MRTQCIHDKGERLVSGTIGRIKAIDVDKNQQRHSIEILHAEFIGRDNTKYPRKGERLVSRTDTRIKAIDVGKDQQRHSI